MDQEFSLTSELREGRLVIVTNGYVNNVGGEAIASEFGRHFENGVKHVVINLAGSKVVNSIGMSFLLEILEQLQDTEGKLVFDGGKGPGGFQPEKLKSWLANNL